MTQNSLSISDAEFTEISRLVMREVGIQLTEAKRTLVVSRLGRRVRELGLPGFRAYLDLVQSSGADGELEEMLNRISTNKTDFFREPVHFDFLKSTVFPGTAKQDALRIWSAASSTGEEIYTIAMTWTDAPGPKAPRVVLEASDISTRVLDTARRAIYDMERVETLPPDLLKRHFLKGTGPHEGQVALKPKVRDLVRFERRNLMEDQQKFDAPFDVVFLRNVLIYFDRPTKQGVIDRMYRWIRPGGWLIIGLSDSLMGVETKFENLGRSVFRRPEAS